jgi:hypothetical protein
MKGILCACLLAALQPMSAARAYEGDVHFSATYVIGRAVGWSEADALTIASANDAMDQNQDTVAALEVDATPGLSFTGYVTSSLHQAGRNLDLHCFSMTGDRGDRISEDVGEVVARHFSAIPDRDDDRRSHSRRLIALGVALHCQQDAYAHIGFGGSCGSYPGSCYGHTYETFLDQVFFGVTKKHSYNPDHPGVSGRRLLQALQGTAREMAKHGEKISWRPLAPGALVELSNSLRGSGLDLPDDVRRDCNRHIAGRWLFELLQSAGRTPGRDDFEKLPPDVAVTCKNASLASATVVRIPEPRYPRLNVDASPGLVRADGSYERARDGDVLVASHGIDAGELAGLSPHGDMRKLKVRLSHWSHLLALPLLTQVIARRGELGGQATTTLASAELPEAHRAPPDRCACSPATRCPSPPCP